MRDVVDLVWEALRLRRLKAQLLTATAYEGMALVLGAASRRQTPIRSRGNGRCATRRRLVTKVEAVLASAGLSWTR